MYNTSHNHKNEHLQLFYVEPERVKDGWFTLSDDEFRHAKKILRKQENDKIFATDGLGNEYQGIIRQVMADRLTCEIEKIRRRPREPIPNVTLIAGIVKGHRFSSMVEKITEIGVSKIIPVVSEFTEISVNQGKIRRWRGVAKAAMKQSGRTILPDVEMPVSFEEAVHRVEKNQVKLIAHPVPGTRRLNDVMDEAKNKNYSGPIQTAALAIGPEGGFSSQEAAFAEGKKFCCFNLGARRLRSETAACVALSVLLFYLGDI